jgi:DNA-directed RNA polymerase subunit RPC12/RpoP
MTIAELIPVLLIVAWLLIKFLPVYHCPQCWTKNRDIRLLGWFITCKRCGEIFAIDFHRERVIRDTQKQLKEAQGDE